MGHERVGALPRSKPWQAVVGGIADAARERLEGLRNFHGYSAGEESPIEDIGDSAYNP